MASKTYTTQFLNKELKAIATAKGYTVIQEQSTFDKKITDAIDKKVTKKAK